MEKLLTKHVIASAIVSLILVCIICATKNQPGIIFAGPFLILFAIFNFLCTYWIKKRPEYDYKKVFPALQYSSIALFFVLIAVSKNMYMMHTIVSIVSFVTLTVITLSFLVLSVLFFQKQVNVYHSFSLIFHSVMVFYSSGALFIHTWNLFY